MQGVTRNDIRMAAVQTIPRQRVAEPGKVNADLMGTARYRKTGNQCMGSAGGQHGVFRHAGLAVFPYTAANDGIAAARNRDVNAARPNGSGLPPGQDNTFVQSWRVPARQRHSAHTAQGRWCFYQCG